MLSARIWLLGTLLAAAPAGGARAQAAALVCHGAQHPGTVAELIFGRDIGRHVGVGEPAWRRFVAREISPRFPDGLTIIGATGQWRDPSRTVVSEPSKLVLIVLPGKASDQIRLDAVVAAYKRQFHQRSVGVIQQPACVLF